MNRLSPLTRAGLQFTAMVAAEAGRTVEKPHPRPVDVRAWECGECGSLHRWEDDAFECCAPAGVRGLGDKTPNEDAILCPVCADPCCDHRDAADCCLWHDLDAPTRWRIADSVEAGDATWAEAISKETTR